MFTVRVKCVCGWWIEVESEGTEGDKQCWKCSGEVRAKQTGGKIVGETKPFMQWEWRPAQVDFVRMDVRR